MTSAGRRLVDAIVERDRDALRAVLSDDVDFLGLTPRRLWEASAPAGVEDAVLGHWFTEQDRISSVLAFEEGDVADTRRVTYRFALDCPGGPHVAEQQAYYRTVADPGDCAERIGYLRVLCSGFRPC